MTDVAENVTVEGEKERSAESVVELSSNFKVTPAFGLLVNSIVTFASVPPSVSSSSAGLIRAPAL